MKLKLIIPLSVAGLIFFFSTLTLQLNRSFIEDDVRRQQTIIVQERLHGLQASVELLLGIQRIDGVEQIFSAMASEPDHGVIFLTDEQGIILASTDYAMVDESFQDTTYPVSAARLKEISVSRGIATDLLQDDTIVGYSSICTRGPGYSLRPTNCGFLYYQKQLGVHYDEKTEVLTNQSWGMVVGGLFCGLLFWLFSAKFITNRLDSLQAKMNRFAEGERQVYGDYRGKDEISVFAQGLHQMFLKIAQGEKDLERSQALQSAILDNTGFSIISTDKHGQITSINRTAEWLLGYSRKELEHKETPAVFHDPVEVKAYAEVLSKEFQEQIQPGFEVFIYRLQIGANVDEHEWTYIRKDGRRIPVRLIVTAIYGKDLEVVGYLGVAEDISLKKEHEESLLLAEKVFRNAGEAIVITDENSKIVDVNPAYCAISGFDYEEVIGQNPSISSSGRHDKEFYDQMWEDVREQGVWSGEVWDRRKDGDVYPKHLTITAVKNDAGRILNYVGTFKDVTAQKELEARLENLAYFDPLTKLPNRALFRDRFEQELKSANRNEKGSALMFIDLDRFKYVNDTLGHEAGDQLLIEVGHRLGRCVRTSDTVARLGGDEFTVILANISDQAHIGSIANEIISSLQQAVTIGDKEAFIGASIGISLYPEDVVESVDLIKKADMAMYRAKEAGRGNFKFFSLDMEEINQSRLNIENQLRNAAANNELQLYYQPKVCFSSGQLAGYEALVRWNNEELGFVMPDRFIPLAEENGMILDIGDWVLDEACRQMEEWIDQGLEDIYVAVNLSAKQFKDPDLLSKVQAALSERNLRPSNLELEITETAMMDDAEESVKIIEQLKALGVKISMDDFGTGYSSLAYLQQFPFDSLKIDLSFVRALGADASAEVIVKTILNMAEGLGISTVAEGVETEMQRDILTKLNCNVAQGYYYGKPVPASEIKT